MGGSALELSSEEEESLELPSLPEEEEDDDEEDEPEDELSESSSSSLFPTSSGVWLTILIATQLSSDPASTFSSSFSSSTSMGAGWLLGCNKSLLLALSSSLESLPLSLESDDDEDPDE